MEDFVDKFCISNNALQKAAEYLLKYKSVKVFVDNDKYKKEVFSALENKFCNIFFHDMKYKTKQAIDKIEYSGEDVVVSFGGGEVCDCAKYYASAFSLPIISIFVDDFFDFNMSKFALISDGVIFDFYKTVSPIAFFVQKREDCAEMNAYARSKAIEYFDYEFSEILLQDKINDDAKQFFKNTLLELRLENFNFVSIVKSFLRLGMAMTFFDTTKYFLSGYFDVFNFLNAVGDKRKAENAAAIISKTYLLAFKYKIKERAINFNLIINKSSKFLKVPSFCVLKCIKKPMSLNEIKSSIIKFNAYKEYLQNLLLRNLISIKNYNVDKTKINSVNYAAFFSNRKSLLKVLTESGLICIK